MRVLKRGEKHFKKIKESLLPALSGRQAGHGGWQGPAVVQASR